MRMTRSVSATLAAAVLAILAACSPRAETPGDEAAASAARSARPQPPGTPRLLRCAPAAADSVVREIGPEGGALALRGNRLVLPAQALEQGVRLRMAEIPSDTVGVDVRPNVVFRRAAALTLSYARCGETLPVSPDSLRIYRRTGNGWTDVGGPVEVNRADRTVTTRRLDHLSQYALGSGG
jgi:hypothetical protein